MDDGTIIRMWFHRKWYSTPSKIEFKNNLSLFFRLLLILNVKSAVLQYRDLWRKEIVYNTFKRLKANKMQEVVSEH